MVGYDGEKMSKSKGNLVFVSALRRAGVDPMAIRLALLAHHYRSDWHWTETDLSQATDRLAAWRDAVGSAAAPAGEPVLAGIRERLADDLDAPGALALVDQWAAATPRSGGDPAASALVRASIDALFGIALCLPLSPT
jgi:L-cysteine:1D-myo-inositol 2-amino-2-deoxy-alpha-D-glucopyranoside ligase